MKEGKRIGSVHMLNVYMKEGRRFGGVHTLNILIRREGDSEEYTR